MPIIGVRLANGASSPTIPGFNHLRGDLLIGAGTLVANLNDEEANPTGISLAEGANPFASSGGSSTLADQTPDPDFPVNFWLDFWGAGTDGEKFVLAGFSANEPYELEIGGHNGNGRNTTFSATNSDPASANYVALSDPDPDPYIPSPPLVFTGTANASGEIRISAAIATSVNRYCNGFRVVYGASLGGTPEISNVDGDNAVNQYQQCNANGVSGLSGPVTSGTLGGQAVTIVDGDWQANSGVVALGLPGGLATGTYSLVLSDGTNSATLTGVSYTQTHARPAFDGLVDSNSILSGQSYTANTYFRFVTTFSNGTLNTEAGDTREWQDDIADYYTPNVGFTGDDTASIEFLYSDGATSATVPVTITVPDTLSPAIDSVSVPTAGTYIAGQALSFTVNWNEAVDVTGTPGLNLDIGGSTRQANYASGTGTTALVFTYTVQEGDEDIDGIAVTSLSLDGGTIRDAAANDAFLTLNSVGDTSGVLVDGVSPVISINALTTTDTSPIVSGSAGDATSLTLVVTGVGTYNPAPSGGVWSQQLPTLALGDYPMTLNGQDANGNAAAEATGTLSVVAELPAAVFALIGPVIEPAISNSLEDVIG